MSNDFSNWSREDLARWLHVNYPAPPGLLTDTSWVFGLRIYIAKEASIDSYSSKVGYEACLDSLAESLASFARDGTLSTEPTERLEITSIPVADRGGGERASRENDKNLLQRAYAAYFREPVGHLGDIPASDGSGAECHNGKYYVVLRNSHGVLKAYRVRSDGALKGLQRYPKAFDVR